MTVTMPHIASESLWYASGPRIPANLRNRTAPAAYGAAGKCASLTENSVVDLTKHSQYLTLLLLILGFRVLLGCVLVQNCQRSSHPLASQVFIAKHLYCARPNDLRAGVFELELLLRFPGTS